MYIRYSNNKLFHRSIGIIQVRCLFTFQNYNYTICICINQLCISLFTQRLYPVQRVDFLALPHSTRTDFYNLPFLDLHKSSILNLQKYTKKSSDQSKTLLLRSMYEADVLNASHLATSVSAHIVKSSAMNKVKEL